MTGVVISTIMTPIMIKTQVYIEANDLKRLHVLAKKKQRSVAEMIREAIRSVWLEEKNPEGPIDLWSKPIHIASTDHDSIYDTY